MDELEVLHALEQIKADYDKNPVEKLPAARSIYLAGGWWGEFQPKLLLDGYEALLNNPTVGHIHVPLLNQYGGKPLSPGQTPDYEWATMTYKADIRAIDNSDLYVGLFAVQDQDVGTAMELGYATASNKPVVSVYDGDWQEYPINLMVSFGTDAYIRSAEELKTFNFLDITTNIYGGKLI
jgi:nucleoside deoxyribosyltransferase